jgi:hypothetical protein
MALDSLTMRVKYHLKEDRFEVEGDIKPEKYRNIVSSFLSSQMDEGEDKRKANELEVYCIKLTWYPHTDRIESRSNTGNLGLRDGILLHFLNKQ